MKAKRHAVLLDIISNNKVGTQDELIEYLEERGFNATQATISRDIKELRLIKTPGTDGKHYYSVAHQDAKQLLPRFHSLFADAVVHIDYAGNIVVVKCLPGTASGTCAALDVLDKREIVGTLSGDDTFICIVKDENQAINLAAEFQKTLRQLED